MVKVITYGTYDHLHQGHINLLKNAKALGDYLIVGVTTENFDINRGKINVQQSLMERIEAVKALGIADEVFPEEYVGQKIDDIKRFCVDIFAVGSDWVGKFDYLKDYCKVVYLPRTEGISSTQIREDVSLNIGIVGVDPNVKKIMSNIEYVNGLHFNGIYFDEKPYFAINEDIAVKNSYDDILRDNDIVYIAVRPEKRYEYVKKALMSGKHVACESPISTNETLTQELFTLAKDKNLVLFDSIKTAFLLSFSRMILLIKSGAIGEVKSVDVTCTSLEIKEWLKLTKFYSSASGWGSIGLLPVFKLLGLDYTDFKYVSFDIDGMKNAYTKIMLMYKNAIATVSLGIGVKSEGDLRISGTKGYIYVPAPWWKSEYFELRYENTMENKPFYYKSEGEGFRMELVHLTSCIRNEKNNFYLDENESIEISKIIGKITK